MVVISLGEPWSQTYEVVEEEEVVEFQSSMPPQVSGVAGGPDRESTVASRLDRESTTSSGVSHMSREEIIEELEAVQAQLHETAQEKETWKSKCHQTETKFQSLHREAADKLETLRNQTIEEIDSLKGECQRAQGQLAGLKSKLTQKEGEIDSLKGECRNAQGQLAGLKNKLTPQFLGVPADEVETLLKGPEPTQAETKIGSCLTNRKFIIFMLYANVVCGAVYLYVFTMHQANDAEFTLRPTWLIIMDWIFCVSFVLAALLRLLVFRLSLRGFWNVFEFTLLPVFIIEQALTANSGLIIDEQIFPRNTFQAVRVLFVFKLVPMLTREFKAWQKTAKPPEPHGVEGSAIPDDVTSYDVKRYSV